MGMAWSKSDVWIIEWLVSTLKIDRNDMIETLRIQRPDVYSDPYPDNSQIGDVMNDDAKCRKER